MKKITVVLLCLAILAALTSCGTAVDSVDGLKIVCTSFVVADWVNNLVGDSDCQITVLCDEGKDMHNFTPAASDIMEILSADLLIYIGGESDKWVESVEKGDDVSVLRLFDVVEPLHCEACHDGHDHADAPDEHIWLSFENALACVSAISEVICALDGEEAEKYKGAALEYSEKISLLFGEYREAAAGAKYRTLVFADRFPFVYLMEELGLEYYAAFPGCSSETSASFETIILLSEAVDDGKLPCVITIEASVDNIAEAVIGNTVNKNAVVIGLDSMQVYHGADFDYLCAMQKNLSALKIALGCE